MANSDIWMPIYIGDYLRDTMSLTAREHGCYLLLLMHYWTEKCLTDDVAELLIITRLEKESKSVLEKILARYFQHEGDCYRQKRIEQEIARVERINDRNRINGQKGGRPRKTQTEPKQKPKRNPNKTNPQSQSQLQSYKKEYEPKVFLAEDEYTKLCERFGGPAVDSKVEDLSCYLGNNVPADKYKDHYLTLLKWLKKDAPAEDGMKVKAHPICALKGCGGEMLGGVCMKCGWSKSGAIE